MTSSAEREAAMLPFTKLEGAGNDFILVDGRLRRVRWDGERIRRVCDRNRGVGGDGLLYIDPLEDMDAPEGSGIRVHYWNADGSRASFCGNGARCAAAYLLPASDEEELRFRLGNVKVRASRTGPATYRISVAKPEGSTVDAASVLTQLKDVGEEEVVRAALVTAGVPHLVLLAGPRLFAMGPESWGPPLRLFSHKEQDGVNVDLLHETPQGWGVRTFERGVERETLCCGSALLAAGWCLVEWAVAELPLTLVPTGGDRIGVGEDTWRQTWFLEGPARIVYRGEVSWPLPRERSEEGQEEI